ncbi:orotidine-5'-phosphate decarboxylase [Acidithiobacillus thiooxidans]|uniref:orotidine-5'-phosphate decarboxylase n=1 Tax=Acidithiobacillus thiooxidans TaxID=930 RepID=UPI0002624A0A|nr:orotidine-5'-phosphate decarboxylase [Acidithiobacillus thiooxidans]MBU2812315.1 orotidine-5'-phosphate decarboxylase [Acidithiobacillus thiooxidans]
MKSPLIVALDYADTASALAMAELLDPRQCRVKVGKELFTASGPKVIEQLQNRGFEVFLDLKFNDIPQTVAKACQVAARLGVWMLNVHASGGKAMLEAAREAVDGVTASGPQPLLIAVTVLTSLDADALAQLGVHDSVKLQVERLAALSAEAGLDGLVCSAQEASRLKQLHPEFCLVTPGIRPAQHGADDQRRTMTPGAALAAGSDYLVIGRPITAAPDPAEALSALLAACAG